MTAVPDLAEPVVAWRWWNIGEGADGPELVSPFQPLTWPYRRPVTAVCRAGCDPPPSLACHCGLYAMNDLGRMAEGRGGVLGCTALWGRVVEHDDGLRAQFAYPLVLFLLPDVRPMLRELARRRRLGPPYLGGDPPARVARGLADGYRVPVRLLAGVPEVGSPEDEQRARAVCAEAAAGLGARRAGDPAAYERLDRAVSALIGDPWCYGPDGPSR